MDEEILQDFLVEAADLVDQLNEQLVELEHSPDDSDLLNAVFRGFHTIKGGAGFLAITPLIEVCHRAENVFDKIRNGEVVYDSVVADAILRAFDVISDSMDLLREGVREMPENDPALLQDLDALTAKSAPVVVEALPMESSLQLDEGVDPDGDMSDEEFEALLNQRDVMDFTEGGDEVTSSMKDSMRGQENRKTPAGLTLAEGVDPDGDMSDEEFEALLNQREELGSEMAYEKTSVASAGEFDFAEDDLSEDDFEALLSQSDLLDGGQSESEVEPAPVPFSSPRASTAAQHRSSAPAEPASTKPAVAKNNTESTVRVDTRRLDEIMNLVGELVLVRNRLLTLKGVEASLEELSNAVGNLDHVTTDLQSSVMKTRMQPVKKVFGRFPRVVRDLARQLGKDINLELKGEETDLDKNLVEALADPLVHLVRNSVDHGIEMPEVRAAAGKPKAGTVVLAAEQEGDHILLSITDDGKGMDPNILRQKAVEKGLMDEVAANQLDDNSAFALILSAGFSTVDAISDISGRGVGMDVVKTMITKLNGSIEIHSVLGEGTKINIRVPLTLAILPTLMVGFDDDSYAIPLTSVQEIFDFNPEKMNKIDGQMMVRLRDRSVPLLFLRDWLAPHQSQNSHAGDKVVIVAVGNQRAGLVVNQVNGQEEVVIKPLGVMLRKVAGYAGATITGNGSIALILDLPGVVERFHH